MKIIACILFFFVFITQKKGLLDEFSINLLFFFLVNFFSRKFTIFFGVFFSFSSIGTIYFDMLRFFIEPDRSLV